MVGEQGAESEKIDAERDIAAARVCSESDISDKSGELLKSSNGTGGPQTFTVFDVRRTGQESLPRLVLEGLATLPVGTPPEVFWGTTKEQLSQTPSESKVPLGRRLLASPSE
jgi:hypothetical protein